MDPLDAFLEALRPLLRAHHARAAYLIGSRARGAADPESDIDVIIVAESDRQERSSQHPESGDFAHVN